MLADASGEAWMAWVAGALLRQCVGGCGKCFPAQFPARRCAALCLPHRGLAVLARGSPCKGRQVVHDAAFNAKGAARSCRRRTRRPLVNAGEVPQDPLVRSAQFLCTVAYPGWCNLKKSVRYPCSGDDLPAAEPPEAEPPGPMGAKTKLVASLGVVGGLALLIGGGIIFKDQIK